MIPSNEQLKALSRFLQISALQYSVSDGIFFRFDENWEKDRFTIQDITLGLLERAQELSHAPSLQLWRDPKGQRWSQCNIMSYHQGQVAGAACTSTIEAVMSAMLQLKEAQE